MDPNELLEKMEVLANKVVDAIESIPEKVTSAIKETMQKVEDVVDDSVAVEPAPPYVEPEDTRKPISIF